MCIWSSVLSWNCILVSYRQYHIHTTVLQNWIVIDGKFHYTKLMHLYNTLNNVLQVLAWWSFFPLHASQRNTAAVWGTPKHTWPCWLWDWGKTDHGTALAIDSHNFIVLEHTYYITCYTHSFRMRFFPAWQLSFILETFNSKRMIMNAHILLTPSLGLSRLLLWVKSYLATS